MKQAIKSHALEVLETLLSPQATIIDLEVRGKWLRARLDTELYFSVKNED